MTELLITPNYDKKTAKFKGAVAAGEEVLVRIEGAAEWMSDTLRLRVVVPHGTLAMFKNDFSLDGTPVQWETADGNSLQCDLDLNTVEMQNAVKGCTERELLVILDDPEENIVYFKDYCVFQGWPRREGDDAPHSLGEFPGKIDEWEEQIGNMEVSAVRNEDEKCVEITAWDGKGDKPYPVKVYDGDTTAAENAARRAAESAAQSYDAAREAVDAASAAESAAKTAAENAKVSKEAIASAKSEAKEYADNKLSEYKAEANDSFALKEALSEEVERAKAREDKIEEKAVNAASAADSATSTANNAKSAADDLKNLVNGISSELGGRVSDVEGKMSALVNGAPETLDTLKEIADWIDNDKTGAAAMANSIAQNSNAISALATSTGNQIANLADSKVEKVPGKGLSTNDYTTADKEKLASITDEEGFVKKSRYAETASDADNAAYANYSEHANNAELATDSQSSMALFPNSDGGSKKNQRSAELIFSQIDEKRKLNDNIAIKAEFGSWRFYSDNQIINRELATKATLEHHYIEGSDKSDGWELIYDGYLDLGFELNSGLAEGDADASFLDFGVKYQDPDGKDVKVIAFRDVITKSGEPYVTPTGVKALVAPGFNQLVPETSEDKVTLKPVDGKANWVDGRVVAQSKVTGRSFSTNYEIRCEYLWVADDESAEDLFSAIFTCPINERNSVIEGIYLDEFEGEWIVSIITTQDIPAEINSSYPELFKGVMIPEGTALSYLIYDVEIEEGCTDLSQCSFRTRGSIPGPWNAMTSIPESLDVDGRHYDRELYELNEGADFTHQLVRQDITAAVALPASTDSAKARRFTLSLETDAEEEKAVEWQGGEVIEAFPGASKLVPGLTVWDVAEVAPGKFRVERASSPAQSAPLTLTAPNGRVAELTVGDDLVLEVKEK